MIKALVTLIVIAVIAGLGWLIWFDATWHKQPWQDSSGKWHNNYVCHPYVVTDYAYITVGTGKYAHTVSIPTGHHTEYDCRYE